MCHLDPDALMVHPGSGSDPHTNADPGPSGNLFTRINESVHVSFFQANDQPSHYVGSTAARHFVIILYVQSNPLSYVGRAWTQIHTDPH